MLKAKFNSQCQAIVSFTQGSALLSALFIMTLVAIATTAMSVRLQSDTCRAQHSLFSDKLYFASQVATYWAMSELSQKRKKPLIGGGKGEILAFPAKLENIYPQMKVQGTVYDLHARFNLNNLLDKQYRVGFLILLGKLKTKLSPSERKQLLAAIIHWITPSKPEQGQGSWVGFYLKKGALPAQQMLHHFSEFRLIQSVDANLYMLLSDFVTALPQITPINLNTAPPTILATLGEGLNTRQIKELMKLRANGGITDLNKIGPLLKKMHVPIGQVTLDSRYFLSITTVKSKDLSLTVYTLLKKNTDKNGKISVSILRENLNAKG